MKRACCGWGEYNGDFTCGSETSDGHKEYMLCRDPTKYAFFDCLHPTQTVYQQLAHLAWNGEDDGVPTNNWRALFSVEPKVGPIGN